MSKERIGSLLGALLVAGCCHAEARAQAAGRIVIEDFEIYEEGGIPHKWKTPKRDARIMAPIKREAERDDDYVEVVARGSGQCLRAYTRNETVQIARINGAGFEWNLETHPLLSWQWRAGQLPEGAREDRRDRNDAGGAVYVTFDCKDLLGRPCTIKYTYSSTLPIGATARYGALHVVVVSQGASDWLSIERNVAADFQRFFGRSTLARPSYIMLWGDSDTTHGASDVCFDNIAISPDTGS